MKNRRRIDVGTIQPNAARQRLTGEVERRVAKQYSCDSETDGATTGRAG